MPGLQALADGHLVETETAQRLHGVCIVLQEPEARRGTGETALGEHAQGLGVESLDRLFLFARPLLQVPVETILNLLDHLGGRQIDFFHDIRGFEMPAHLLIAFDESRQVVCLFQLFHGKRILAAADEQGACLFRHTERAIHDRRGESGTTRLHGWNHLPERRAVGIARGRECGESLDGLPRIAPLLVEKSNRRKIPHLPETTKILLVVTVLTIQAGRGPQVPRAQIQVGRARSPRPVFAQHAAASLNSPAFSSAAAARSCSPAAASARPTRSKAPAFSQFSRACPCSPSFSHSSAARP